MELPYGLEPVHIAMGVGVLFVVGLLIFLSLGNGGGNGNEKGSFVPAYTFHLGKDRHGADIERKANLQNNINALKARCNELSNCKSFNTGGWIKHKSSPLNSWRVGQAGQGLYIKK